ncbi:hypothetical protein DYH09_31470 [bacterium CPR1]|nr:hypothetical protein [bacterium CPR1]
MSHLSIGFESPQISCPGPRLAELQQALEEHLSVQEPSPAQLMASQAFYCRCLGDVQSVRTAAPVWWLPGAGSAPRAQPLDPMLMLLGPMQSGGSANFAALLQMYRSDQQQAFTIWIQTLAEAKKQQAQRWKIMCELKTKIFEIQQEVAVNQARAQSKALSKWSDYIRS